MPDDELLANPFYETAFILLVSAVVGAIGLASAAALDCRFHRGGHSGRAFSLRLDYPQWKKWSFLPTWDFPIAICGWPEALIYI